MLCVVVVCMGSCCAAAASRTAGNASRASTSATADSSSSLASLRTLMTPAYPGSFGVMSWFCRTIPSIEDDDDEDTKSEEPATTVELSVMLSVRISFVGSISCEG